jgi:hypothetical protein
MACIRAFIDIIVKGTPLDPDPDPTQQEIEEHVFDEEKLEELRRLAREEARAQYAAEQAEKDLEKQEAIEEARPLIAKALSGGKSLTVREAAKAAGVYIPIARAALDHEMFEKKDKTHFMLAKS